MAERDWYRIVQDGACPVCGFDAAALDRVRLGAAIGDEADAWDVLLAEPVVDLRRRPGDGSWTALEYACHVRDVLDVFTARIERAGREEAPVFGWWDHEAAAVEEAYDDQDPVEVAAGLRHRAEAAGAVLAAVHGDGWERTGIRRAGEQFTVEGLARFALHEAHHHRLDAEAAIAATAT